MDNVKVSVITGYYNREKFVTDSIESILNQTYSNIEYIIFDDASTDNTTKLISDIKDERVVKLLFKKNKGFVKALIEAVNMSTGDYIFIHGAGDISLPTRIEKQLKILQSKEYGLVGSYYQNISEDNEVINLVKTEQDDLTFEKMLIYNRLSHGEVGFRKDIYNKVGGYDKRFIYSQDYELWLRMIKHTKFYVIPEVLYNRRMIQNSVSIKPQKILEQTKYAILAAEISKYPEKKESLLSKLDHSNISEIISSNNIITQKICIKKSILLINFGYFDDASFLIGHIHNKFFKFFIRAVFFIIKYKIIPRRLLDRFIKIGRSKNFSYTKLKNSDSIKTERVIEVY